MDGCVLWSVGVNPLFDFFISILEIKICFWYRKIKYEMASISLSMAVYVHSLSDMHYTNAWQSWKGPGFTRCHLCL